MKPIKPGRIDNTFVEEEKVEESYIKPTKVEEEELVEEIVEEEKKRLTILKGISSFAKKSAVVMGLLAGIVIIGAIYDAFYSASSMLTNAPALGIVYVVMIFALVGILGYGIFKEMVGYRKIKRIDQIQEEAKRLRTRKGKNARLFAQKIISMYRDHEDEEIRYEVEEFEKELPSLMDDEIMGRLEEKILSVMDEKAKNIITKYANQTAISTAISPVAMIDAILILSRSHVMIKEIAKVYNLRPNLLGEMALIKKVFVNLAFAGVTDIMLHHSHDILGASVLSKVSAHGAQGVANGILTARVGLSTLRACRPIELSKKQDGFFKNIFKMITKSLFVTKK
jgi:putative membrane protein